MSLMVGNSSLGIHSADLANRHKARTQSPLSLCRFAKNYESNTANTSIVCNAESETSPSLAEGARGWVNPIFSSLRGSLSEAKTTKQSILNRHSERSEESKNHHCKANRRFAESNINFVKTNKGLRGSILDEKSGLRSYEQGNRTDSSLTKRIASLPDLSLKDKRA